MDIASRLIWQLTFTSASVHDKTQLEELLSDDERSVFADKAYAGKEFKRKCRKKDTYYGILDKAYRNRPLSGSQQKRNDRHRRVRRYGEHPFAGLKNRYGAGIAGAKTKLRNKAKFIISAICWNIEQGIRWANRQQKKPGPIFRA